MDNYVIHPQSLVYARYTVFNGALVSCEGSELNMEQIAITSDKPKTATTANTAWDEKINQRKKQLQEAKGER